MKLMTTLKSLPLLFMAATGGEAWQRMQAASRKQSCVLVLNLPSKTRPTISPATFTLTRYFPPMTQRRYRPAPSLSTRALGPHGIRIRRAST